MSPSTVTDGREPAQPAAEVFACNPLDVEKIERILVATDLSARSDRAVERAFQLAKTHGADVMVLHVVERSLPSSMRRQVMKAAEDDIRAGLEKLGGADPQDTRVDVVIGSGHSSIV
ncbi:MAG: universal stress protein, partial [Pseudomonadota bacterium]